MLLKSKGWVSDGEAVYSPGQRRKQKEITIISTMAWMWGSGLFSATNRSLQSLRLEQV